VIRGARQQKYVFGPAQRPTERTAALQSGGRGDFCHLFFKFETPCPNSLNTPVKALLKITTAALQRFQPKAIQSLSKRPKYSH
jgi:hypothetical protein